MQKTLANQPISRDNGGASDEAGHAGVEAPDVALTTDAGEGIDMADPHSSKSPAFQFYPNDFLSDANVIVMSLQERGAYITLICVCWQQGALPNNVDQLARFCGAPVSVFRRLWPAIQKCFRPSSDGATFTHPRLERERKKQREYRKLQSEKGKASAARRNRGSTVVQPRLDSGSTDGQPAVHGPVQPKGNSSSSVFSFPSSDSSQTKTSARESDETTERAGHFCNEVYPALYAKYRKGARYISRPALDFQEAVQLCRTWDDERLAKIAAVFLTTDHDFAEKGSRTMAQFRSLASWCDSQLVEYEAKHGPITVAR